MKKLLSPVPPGQLFSPEGNPVHSDLIMALNKWVLHLNEDAPRIITLTGIGRPTYPVNEKLTNAAMRYWGTLAENAAQTRRDIKKLERSLKKSEKESEKALLAEILENAEAERSITESAVTPRSPKGLGKIKGSLRKVFQIPFDKLKDFMAHGSAAVHYTAPSGDKEPREVIAEALSRFYKLEGESIIAPNQILFTVGGSSALFGIFQAINDEQPHGRIITANPYYSLHAGAKKSNRLHTIDVMKLPGYRLTAQALKSEIAIAKQRAQIDGGRISAFVLSYPNNPTGQVLGREEWEQIAQVLREDKDLADVRIVLDEAYAELQLDGKEHFSLFQVAPDLHYRIALIRCGTKGLSAAGERMGVVICKDPVFMEQIVNVLNEIHGHAPKSACHAYAAALDELSESEQSRLVSWYSPMVDYVFQNLKAIGANMPDETYQANGTFYVMADLREFIGTPMIKEAQKALPGITTIQTDEHLVYHLLFKEQIMVAPLSYFGADPHAGFVRITCSDVNHIEAIILRLNIALRKLREEKCGSLHPKVAKRLNDLNQASPEAAAELVNSFNSLGLGSFKITKQSVNFSQVDLLPLELKQLNQKLADLYLNAGARIKRELSGGQAQAANRLRGFFRENVEHKKSERFFKNVHKLWCLWVDNFFEEKDRVATKMLPPMDCIKKYPKWGVIYKAFHAEYVKKGFDSLNKTHEFNFEQFAKKMIVIVKKADADYLIELECKFGVSRLARSSDTFEDSQSSADATPRTTDSVNKGSSSEVSSMSSSPLEDGSGSMPLAKRLNKKKLVSSTAEQKSGLVEDPNNTSSQGSVSIPAL